MKFIFALCLISSVALAQGKVNTGGVTVTAPLAGDGAGVPLSITGVSGTNTGDISLATAGSTPAAAGASLVGQVLTLQPADATNAGLVSTGTQTFAGAKTFSTSLATNGTFSWGTSSNATGGSVTSNTIGALVNQTLNLKGWVADGAAAIGLVLDTQTTLSTAGAKIASFRNNTVEKVSIDKDGAITSGPLNAVGSSTNFGINLNNASVSPAIVFSTSGTIRSYFGVAFANDALATGTATGGVILRSQDKPFYISLNGAGTQSVMFSFETSGGFTIKPGTLGTCTETRQGETIIVGGAAAAKTKKCTCTWDGSTAYWINELTAGGLGLGNASTCPAT